MKQTIQIADKPTLDEVAENVKDLHLKNISNDAFQKVDFFGDSVKNISATFVDDENICFCGSQNVSTYVHLQDQNGSTFVNGANSITEFNKKTGNIKQFLNPTFPISSSATKGTDDTISINSVTYGDTSHNGTQVSITKQTYDKQTKIFSKTTQRVGIGNLESMDGVVKDDTQGVLFGCRNGTNGCCHSGLTVNSDKNTFILYLGQLISTLVVDVYFGEIKDGDYVVTKHLAYLNNTNLSSHNSSDDYRNFNFNVILLDDFACGYHISTNGNYGVFFKYIISVNDVSKGTQLDRATLFTDLFNINTLNGPFYYPLANYNGSLLSEYCKIGNSVYSVLDKYLVKFNSDSRGINLEMKVLTTLPSGYRQGEVSFNMVADSLNNKLHLFKTIYEDANDKRIYLDGQTYVIDASVRNFNHYIIDLNKLEQ